MNLSTHIQPVPDQLQPPTPVRTWLLATWLIDGTPARSPWRVLASLGAAGEAVAHIPVIDQHLTEAPYIGVAFLLLAVAGLALGHLLLAADTTAVWASTLIVSALALGGYFLSRTTGLPQIHDEIGNWSEPLGIVAVATETVMLLTATMHFVSGRAR